MQVELLADGNGGFVRMLGFELGVNEGTGPKCQRFAGIVDNGILLKVVRYLACSPLVAPCPDPCLPFFLPCQFRGCVSMQN